MYRPEGWKNPINPDNLPWFIGLPGQLEQHSTYEAGADAMLEALRESGISVIGSFTFISIGSEQRIDGPGMLVIIPEG